MIFSHFQTRSQVAWAEEVAAFDAVAAVHPRARPMVQRRCWDARGARQEATILLGFKQRICEFNQPKW